jgi:hypothetical protein
MIPGEFNMYTAILTIASALVAYANMGLYGATAGDGHRRGGGHHARRGSQVTRSGWTVVVTLPAQLPCE